MTKLTAGIYADIPMLDYINDPAPDPSLSTGTACALINECPAKAKAIHPRLNPEREDNKSAASDIGTICHHILLVGSMDEAVVVVDEKDWRKNVAKEARDAAYAAGKVPLLAHQGDEVKAMHTSAVAALKSINAEIGSPVKMVNEQTLIWQHQETGIWCRSRPDMMTPDFKYCVEYKTTATSVHPSAFGKFIANQGYDVQGALIRDGVHTLKGHTPDIIFMAQENKKPYLVSFIGLAPMYAEAADTKFRAAAMRWAWCLQQNFWPGYPNRIAWVEPAPWELAKVEELSNDISI